MKLVQIVCTFPPYNGGMGNSVYNLWSGLKERGIDATVFTPFYDKKVLRVEDSEHGRRVTGVKRLTSFFKIGNGAFLPQLLWKLHKYKVIHLHLPFLGGSLPVFFHTLFHPKKKLIVTYHMDLVAEGLRGMIFKFYTKVILLLLLMRANKIIVSSYDYAENSDIRTYFKKHKNKFEEIPFWVDTDKFIPKEKDAELLKKYFIEPGEKVLMFLGGLDRAHYFKGLAVLLKAFKKLIVDEHLEDIKLLVVGDGDLKVEYMDMADGLGIRDSVIFTGKVSDEDLPKYYNLSDIFILPSTEKSEAFGIVLLEAGACGKPLIASNLPGVRTVVGDAGFLAEPGNAEDLKEKIKNLIINNESRLEFGKKAREAVLEKYNKEKIMKKYMGLL